MSSGHVHVRNDAGVLMEPSPELLFVGSFEITDVDVHLANPDGDVITESGIELAFLDDQEDGSGRVARVLTDGQIEVLILHLLKTLASRNRPPE
jgi:hypothetical protein